METFEKILKEIKEEALKLDGKLLCGFCIVFAVVGSLMSLVNCLAQSYHMAGITGGMAVFMLGTLLLYRKTKQIVPVFGSMASVVFLMMAYFLISGGENGFSAIWLLLVPPVACSIFQMYYGGMFSIALGILTMVYMWTPLHELGYEYTETYLIRFPVVYLADMVISLVTQYRLWISGKKQKEAYRRMEEADSAKGIFLSNMSHEARTPINSILGFNEMILKESQESNTISNATNIQTAGRVLLSIVNDTLDFVNIQEGTLYLEKEPYSIMSVLQDLVAYGTYHAEKKKLEFRFEMSETLPQKLIGDAMRLSQVCNNLISNAIKYTNTGYVELAFDWKSTGEKKGILLVHVKDTGIGIRKEELGKILDSFTRVDERKTKHVQGIGLGLPLVTRLLDMMGSRPQVESVYGEGSVFSFALEQEDAGAGVVGNWKEQQNQEEKQEEKLFWAPEAKILAVDDNMMNLDLLRGMLQKVGIKPDFAMNGEEAIECIKKKEYDLILMDHMMPVMDGMEAMKVIEKENLCSGVPVVVLTANAVAGAKEMYLEAGFDDYLSKPVTGKMLFAAIGKYLSPVLVGEKTEQKPENPGSSGKLAVQEVPGITAKPQSILEQLTLFDTRTGLGYCAENEEFYKEMLLTFLKKEKLEDIQAFYEIKDWNNYRILVHALKSTSLSIGAVTLSEEAKQLELAAKEENHYYIDSHHADAMKLYRNMLDQISQVLLEKKEEDTPQEVQEISGHIVVVDDDAMNLKIAEHMLAPYFEVSLMDSAKDALELLERRIPDLILLDLHMPEIDGFEMMDLLREREEWKDIPVVFLTADNDREVEVRGFKEGAQDFITKPFIAEIMIQRVSRILELSSLQKDLHKEVAKQTRWAEERRKKVERLSQQIMHTLAGTIDAKDKYTNGHSVRVAQYSLELAKKAGKEEKEQERIYFMGMLHDIGKIGIPDTIITKQSGLTDEEYALICSHPVIGAEILQNISEIPKLDVGARWHHERYDGKGYPDGLSGEQIPEEARLIAVADAYDAMASRRSYRDVLPQKEVYEEIRKGAGTQFDPHYAKLMLELMEDDKEYLLREM